MKPPLFLKHKPQRILVISLRFLGDTLLITPLLNSLKKAYPEAEIDVLTYGYNALILEGNPAISQCIFSPKKPTLHDYNVLLKQIYRRYDLAMTTQTGDRLTLYAVLAAKTRIGFIPKPTEKRRFKRYFFQRWLTFDETKTHTVLELLRLCQLLAIKPVYELTPPSTTQPLEISRMGITSAYVVIHVLPQWRYKQWTEAGWIAVAHHLKQQGLQVLLSGSPVVEEVHYLMQLQKQFPTNTINLAGKVSLAHLAMIIEGAQLFIGPDTGITHLAAATKVKTIALLGPSDPVKWSPWPNDYHSTTPPFKTRGCQQVNNIYIIQGQEACVPCYSEGCERHQNSYSLCLDSIRADQVIKTIDRALNKPD
ncbi:MAG: glycosyltransferase family 9 protein [Methylococcales bacterium]|nr:glycosyltransferase family 9 protein [Methylococcales bacterium]